MNGLSGWFVGFGEEVSSVGFYRRVVAVDDDGSVDDGCVFFIVYEVVYGVEECVGVYVYVGVYVFVDDCFEFVFVRLFFVVYFYR